MLDRIADALLAFDADPRANIGRLTAVCGELLGADAAFYHRLEGPALRCAGRWRASPDHPSLDFADGRVCLDVIKGGGDGAVWLDDIAATPYASTDGLARRHGAASYAGHAVRRGGVSIGAVCALFRSSVPRTDEAAATLSAIAAAIRIQEEHVAAEGAVRDSEERSRRILESAPIGMALVGLDGRLGTSNRAFERMVGRESAELAGERLDDLLGEDDGRAQQALDAVGLGEWPVKRFEASLRLPDAGVVWTEATVTVIRDADGAPLCGLAMFEDTSERRKAAEALRESERQLLQSQKMEAIGRLAGGVAHDFNNILTAILGFNDIVLERLGPDDPMFRDASEVKHAAIRASSLTRQLLAFTRRQVVQPRPLDLNELVGGMEKMLKRLIGEDIELATSLQPELAAVEADPGQLEQVLLNLVVNARDAMPEGGRVVISTAAAALGPEEAGPDGSPLAPGPYARIAVSDSGCGMDEGVRSRLFEAFFTTKAEGRGTGLGLATVYSIVQQARGHIRVESQPGFGATFEVFLPFAKAAPEEAEGAEDIVRTLRGSETVLLVEDDQSIRELGKRFLERNGYKVLEARDGAEALSVVERHEGPLHLLVTDVVMPILSGPDLADRAWALRSELKVLFMSGYTGDTPFVDRVADSGASFLQKPFTPDGLLAKVRETLDAPPAEAPAPVPSKGV